MTDGPALLELTGVSKRFGRITVADQLSLRFRPGELVGIVGPNGAGKTTLFAMIAGDVAPDTGDVVFDGRSLGRLDPASRCKLGIARTYQVPQPFDNMTVFENLLVAAYRGGRLSRIEGYQVAAGILEQTGLSRHANTPAGRLGLLQRKRLELARGLATRPRVLLLDEVAGGLTDPEVVQLVDIVGQAQAQGITIVWVEHVVHALTRSVSHVICLAGGRLIAEGRPQEVLDNPQVKEVYLGADFRGDQGQIPSPPGGGQADIPSPSGGG
jgi:branched-chain amino acid transport system ATP-binding protein